MPVPAIPPGYHSVTPYLVVRGAVAAMAFYQKAFGATELLRLVAPDGRIAHAEFKIGNSPVMLAEESEGYRSPQTLGGTASSLMVYVPNVDALFAQAVAAGATMQRPVADQFYGDRSGTLIDPFGHVWTLATHTEDVPQAELDERFRKLTQS